jgi:hypothetical protein
MMPSERRSRREGETGGDPATRRGDTRALARVLAERGPLVLRVWEALVAGGPADADLVRAAVAELLAAPPELGPPWDGAAEPAPLRAGSALSAAARGAFPALVDGLAFLPLAVREVARALGTPLVAEDDVRLAAVLDRSLAAAARAHAEHCEGPG